MTAAKVEAKDDVGADVVLVGGGLANGLAALAIASRRPDLRLVLLEREARTVTERAAADKLWCCFASDIDLLHPNSGRVWSLLEPVIAARWSSHRIAFPGQDGHEREGGYVAVASDRLRASLEAVLARPGNRLITGVEAIGVEPGVVVLADGTLLRAPLVLDGRGAPKRGLRGVGFQKFFGQELAIVPTADWPGTSPAIMDAAVEQVDGYRFMYVLPLAPGRVLVEDTTFADGPALDGAACACAVRRYVEERGARVEAVLREEAGVLPMPWQNLPAPAPAAGLVRIGYAGGLFHAGTGYSLATAALVADAIAEAGPAEAHHAIAPIWKRMRAQNRFFRLLNRLMFRGVAPTSRRELFERFYRLSPAVIRRFYAAATTLEDRVRLLAGRPPRGLSVSRLLTPMEAT